MRILTLALTALLLCAARAQTLAQSCCEPACDDIQSSCAGRFNDCCDDSCCGGCSDGCAPADSCCGGGCSQGCCGGCGESLFGFGLIKRSDHDFDSFISPITNPVFFEDPRTLTEARAIFLHHHLPSALGGDDVQVYALQLRAALSENLSLIATKDGFIVSHSPLLDDGWADVAPGLKYNLYKDSYRQRLLSAGLLYEMPVGTPRALQGNGDGEFNLFLTGGTQLGRYGHWISAAGFRLPVDPDAENQVFYWSNHLDRQIFSERLYVLTELNWYHWLDSGTAFGLPVEGVDLFNLGSVDVAGNDIVTAAWGFKYKPSRHQEIGIAYEIPLTEREGLLAQRLTLDWIFRY